MISRVFYLLIAGGLGGLLGWLVSEPFAPGAIIPLGVDTSSKEWQELFQRTIFHQNIFGLASGLFIGALIGGASGWAQGSMKQIKRGLGLGAVMGAVAGGLGVWIASVVYAAMMAPYRAADSIHAGSPIQLVARAVGWGIFGMLLGGGQAIATGSSQRIRQGAIGGLIGGAIGGVAFEISAFLLAPVSKTIEPGRSDVGRFSRAIGLVCIGAGIGLFIGLVEMLMRSAWVRVLAGRNEGKEYLVDASRTIIGRSEMADIALYGDAQVAPQHAVIDRVNREYVLIDGGSPAQTFVNRQPVQQTALHDGDVIHIGQFELQFRLKSGQGVRAPVDTQRAPMPMSATPANVCPYCGEIRDSGGNCACSALRTGVPIATTAVATAGFALVAVDGPLVGQRFEVGQSGLAVGREALGGVALPFDPRASRKHAHIQLEADGCVIYDDGSTNGTYVNSRPVTRQPLTRGDVVTVGTTNFRVE